MLGPVMHFPSSPAQLAHMPRRMMVTVSGDAFRRLARRALTERRNVRDQAAVELERALDSAAGGRGALPAAPPHHSTTNR